MLAPTAAERARSALARADRALLRVPGAEPIQTEAFAVAPDGDLLVLVGADTDVALRCPHQPRVAVVEATDRCPLPVADDVRGRVWVAGVLHEVDRADVPAAADLVAEQRPTGALLGVGATSELLRVEVLTIEVVRGSASLAAAEAVDWTAYATAEPDPLVPDEPALLEHLVAAHLPELRRICALLDPVPALPDGLLAPVLIDRYGIVVRVRAASAASGRPTVRDARLSFSRRVDAVEEVAPRFEELLGLAARA